MSAYVVFLMTDVSDPAALAAYRAAAPKSMAGRGINFLAGPTVAATLEGDALKGAVILEFPSRAEAEAWYTSAEYQQAAQIRHGAATCSAFILESRA